MDKILYVMGITRPGGAWESLRDILTTLDRRAFEPLLACSTAPAWSSIQEEVRALRIRMPMWRKRKNILRIPFAVVRLRKAVASEHVAIVHANSIWDIPYALWAARPFGVPVVAHIRTEIDRKKARKYSVGKVDAAIATSSKCIKVLKSFSRLESRVHYIPNGANLERFNPSISGETVRHEYGLDSETVVFGAFGRIDRTKGLDVLISAFSEVTRRVGRAKLLLVGDIKGKGSSFKEELIRDINSLGLSDAVLFAGWQQDVVPYLAAIDVLVMPSRIEDFGRSAVEAMAMRNPVIASDTTALPEIVVNGKTGYIVPVDDVTRLAESMTELALNPAKREAFGQAGRERAQENFELKKLVLRIEMVYAQLIARNKR